MLQRHVANFIKEQCFLVRRLNQTLLRLIAPVNAPSYTQTVPIRSAMSNPPVQTACFSGDLKNGCFAPLALFPSRFLPESTADIRGGLLFR
jgi:hypothetical protein